MNTVIFQYSSAVVGAITVLAVAYVFVRQFTFKWPGFGLLISGTILIGLPVWQSAKLSWGKEGFNLEFQTLTQKIDALSSKVNDVQTAYAQTGDELKAIAANVEKVRATSNLALVARMAEASPDQSNELVTKFQSLWKAGAIDPKEAEKLAKDPQLQGWIFNSDVLSGKVGEKLPEIKLQGSSPKIR